MNTTLRELILNINIKEELSYMDFYEEGISGKKIHDMIISRKASERNLLDLSRLSQTQIDELYKCGTLCWNCQHSSDLKCGWFRGFHPVPGWIASLEICMNRTSYMVYDCPNFSRTERFLNENEDTPRDQVISQKIKINENLAGNIRL